MEAMPDKYDSIAQLECHEILGRDYRIHALERSGSPVIVIAPHGGLIEIGTSELASLIAGEEHSLFSFEGLKPYGTNRQLHITSHRFDHPQCLELTARHAVALAVHGCIGESQIYLGGLDLELTTRVEERLRAAGLPAMVHGHRYPGRNPLNICNRGTRGRGVQLEITHDLRAARPRSAIAAAVRQALEAYIREPDFLPAAHLVGGCQPLR
jgi:phage replication-related protein YjqB (UPF0714/DUF867 family)